jgi:hypothetical protein
VWAGHVTINTLPDDVLLHIFLIDGQEYHDESQASIVVLEDYDRVKRLRWTWHRLVHVCRRWRSIVFASPNYLDLRLVCGPMTTIGAHRYLATLANHHNELVRSELYYYA